MPQSVIRITIISLLLLLLLIILLLSPLILIELINIHTPPLLGNLIKQSSQFNRHSIYKSKVQCLEPLVKTIEYKHTT